MSVTTVYAALNAALSAGTIDLWSASADTALAPLRGVLGLFGITDAYTLSDATLTQGLERVTLTGSGRFGQPGDPQGMRFPVQGRLLYTEGGDSGGVFQLSLTVTSPGWTFSGFFNPAALPASQRTGDSALGPVIWGPSILADLALLSPVFQADSRPDATLTLSGRLPEAPVFGPALDMLAPWPLALDGSLTMPPDWETPPVLDLVARAAGSATLAVGSPAQANDGPGGLSLSDLGLEFIVRDDLDATDWGRTRFSVVNLTGTVRLGSGADALVARLYTPLLVAGPQWRLTALFDPDSASVVRGMAQLTTIFGLPALPLPDNFPLIETFKFREVNLTFTTPAGGLVPDLRDLAVTIVSDRAWSPPIPFVTLRNVGTRWLWAWGAVRGSDSVVRSTGTVSGAVFGTLRFSGDGDGDSGSDGHEGHAPPGPGAGTTAAKVDIDVAVSLPELLIQGEMREGDRIPIGAAFTYYFGAPGPAVGGLHAATVTELGFAADPIAQNYSGHTQVVFTDADTGDPVLTQGWAIDLVVITLVLEEVEFWIASQNGQVGGGLSGVFSFVPSDPPDDYESPRLMLSAAYPVQDPETPVGWVFEGHLYQGTVIDLTDVVARFLGLGAAPASVPHLTVDRLDVRFATEGRSYALGGTISGRWTPELFGTPLKVSASASIDIARDGSAPAETPAHGRLGGTFQINRIAVEVGMDVGVDEPTYLLKVCVDTLWVQAVTAWRGETGSETNPRHQVVSVQLGGATLGDMLEYLVNLAAPTIGFQLDAPWDILKRVELSSFVLTLDPTRNVVEFVYRAEVDLGFGSLSSIGVRYSHGGAGKVELILEGALLGQDYTGDDALAWDVVNDPPPAVPGTGTGLVDLRYLGLGQRIRIQDPPDTVAGTLAELKAFMKPVDNPGNLPGPTGKIAYSADSQWLIGLDIGLMAGTVDLGFLFNDPILYGLSVGLNGEKAGSLAGLRFEILYKKISDDVGMFRVELRLPDAFRTFQIGVASITLGTVVVEVYTNGNFKVDLGFPYNQDFTRSFSVQAYIFIGRGGVYVGLLDGVTSSQVPRITNGTFAPVLELGVGLAAGVGREIRAGILAGGAYVEVQVIFQGVLGWFNPASAGQPPAQYFRALGIAAMHGKVYGYVDFKVIKVSVTLEAYAQVAALFEAYRPTTFEMLVSVDAQAKVKVLFIKVSFNFHVELELTYVLGTTEQTPWIVAPGGDPAPFRADSAAARLGLLGTGGTLVRGGSGYARRNRMRRLAALRDHHLRRARARRALVLGPGRSLAGAWGWDPDRALFPDGEPRQALLHLLPTVSLGAPPVDWTTTPDPPADPLYRVAFLLCANSGETPEAATAAATSRRSARQHALAADDGDTDTLTPDLWVKVLLLYCLYAIPDGPATETDPVTAGQLALLTAALDDPETADLGFAWDMLDRLFATNLHLLLAGDPGGDATEVGGMVAPLPPGLTRTGTPGGTVDFAAINPVGPWYEWGVARRTGDYLPVGGAAGPRPAVDDPAAYESYPTYIFRDYCLMIAKAAVKEAQDLLAVARVTVADGGDGQGQTLADLAGTFPSATVDYAVRSGDTVESVADALGASAAELTFLNPDLAQRLAAAPVGSTLSIALGVAPEVLAQDNADQAFALDTVTLGNLPHQVADGETLDGIAALFNLDSATALFTGPGGDRPLGAATQVLRGGSVFDLPARIWQAGPDSRLMAAATAYVRYVLPSLDPAAWYAQAVYDINRDLLSTLTGNDRVVTSLEIPPGHVLQVPQAFNAVSPTMDYTTVAGDTLDRIAAALTLVQVYPDRAPEQAPDWLDFLAGVTETGANSYGLPAWSGLPVTPGDSMEALARRLILDATWTQDGSDPARGTWTYAWPAILGWAGAAPILAPLAVVPVPGAVARAPEGGTLSFAVLSRTYGLSVADAADRLADRPGLYAIGTDLTVTQLPVMTVAGIVRGILDGEALPRVVNQASRSLLGGLRTPLPVEQDGHVVPSPDQTAPLYDLTGQQFDLDVDTDPDKGGDPALSLTLTSQTAWVTLVDSTVSEGGGTAPAGAFGARAAAPRGMVIPTAAAAELTYAYSNAEIIAMGPATAYGIPVAEPPAAMPLAERSPRAHGLTHRIEVQTPIALPIPGMDGPPVSAQPSLWPFPEDLRARALAGSTVPYDLLATAEGEPTGRAAATVAEATWASRIPVRIKQVNDDLTLFALHGVAEADRPVLLALRQWLADGAGAGTVVHVLARPAPNAGNAAGLALLPGAPTDTFIIQANLSTETVPRPPDIAAGRTRALARGDEPERPAASLAELERFVTLLWEGSVVGGVGYAVGLEAGLPASALDENGIATIDLLVIAGSQQDPAPEGRPLLPFNTCALVAPGLEAAIDTLYAEDHGEQDTILQALVPPGSAGFTLALDAPPDQPPGGGDTEAAVLQLRRLFSLLGVAIPQSGASPYVMAASGMPAPPAPSEASPPPAWKRARLVRRGLRRDRRTALEAEPLWRYDQILPLSRFAGASALPAVPGLPDPQDDPYRGFGRAQSLPTATASLTFHDILGNRTGPAPEGQGTVAMPTGYTDPLIGVGDWPAVVTGYTVQREGDRVSLTVSVDPRPSTVMPGPAQPGDAAAAAAGRQAEAYAKSYYQLGQTLTATVTTSLDTSANHAVDPALLWRFAAAAQAFNAAAARLGAARAPEGATLGSIATEFGVRPAEMALANADRPMEALFGSGASVVVPAFAVFAENDTAETLAGATRPAGWPRVKPEALLADPENGTLPLRVGAALAVSPPLTHGTGDGSPSLADLADALGTTPGPLARDNAAAPILQEGVTFSVAVSDDTVVTVTVTGPDGTPPIRSFDAVCAAFAAAGVTVTPLDLGETHADRPGLFQADETVASTQWVAAEGETLASTGSGLSQAQLAALNTATPNLFDMGALIHLGAFNDGAGITPEPDQTLRQFADAYACPRELLLAANPDLAVPADGLFAIPGLAVWPADPALARNPYTLRAGDTLDAVAPRFAWPGDDPALALATDNAAMPRVLAGDTTLQIPVGGETVPITTPPDGESLAEALAQVRATAPDATLADLVAGIGADAGALQPGALLICPPARFAGAATPGDIPDLFGLGAGALALANAGTPGLIAPGVTVRGPDGLVSVETRANDSFNSLIVRFAEAGVQVDPAALAEAPANRDIPLFAAGALALLPPSPARITLPIGANGPYPGPAFSLRVQLSLARPTALVNPDFEPGAGGGVERVVSVIPAPQGTGDAADSGGLTLNAFIAALVDALPNLRVATGRAADDRRDLWAVDFGAAGIRSLTIAGTTTVPGAPGPQPRFFALAPLYTRPVGREGVSIRTLRPDGALSPHAEDTDFQGIDTQPWATRFLSDMDRILSAGTAAALYRTAETRDTLAGIVTVKRDLAGAIAEGLAPVLEIDDPQQAAGQAAAAATLEQRLGVSLSQAWSAAALVQLDRTVSSPWQDPESGLAPADLYGGITVTGDTGTDRSWTMTAAKCWLTDRSPFVTMLLSEADPATHRAVTADMAFGITDMERNIVTAGLPQGYASSQWLSFLPPLSGDHRPAALSSDLGTVSVPIPLRVFPALPEARGQSAAPSALDAPARARVRARRRRGTVRAETDVPLADMALWDHAFTYAHEHAEQDEVTVTLRYNLRPGDLREARAETEDLFPQLARYMAVADDLWAILDTLAETDGPLSPTQRTAAGTFLDLARPIADHWTIRHQPEQARRSRAAADLAAETFAFRARVTDRDGAEAGTREVDHLTLTALETPVGPDGVWPQVTARTVDGRAVSLAPETVSETITRYQVPEGVRVPALWPTFTLTVPDLNVARWQNATGSIAVRRNQKLLGPDGPETNAAFVFQTDTVEAASVVTPFNPWDERVPLQTGPEPEGVAEALQAAFETLFGADALDGSLTVTMGVSYAYELATDPLDPRHGLIEETPIYLYPNQPLTDQTAGVMQSAVAQWRATAAPVAQGGEWVFSLTLYSALEDDQRPLLTVERLFLPLAPAP
ncbi:hypothetical protein [Roseospira goensis]|uniref:LysM peptidoglycan-binding domain-containing protein n=1 Tax=Roseospira goensis TaxID=391922 RepID=A0A7W6WIU6_9PROT|nr:hypothetical protein [Roseospira goensis]MBB4284581.1 hypothetical protein [Roseospira goensis]